MTFETAVEFVLTFEGGYSNSSSDPGGETNFGISRRAYPHLDIKALTRDDAVVIYKRDFWDACKCDQIGPPLNFLVFDTAVNMGQPTAIMLLQEALGVKDDGIIGDQTLRALGAANAGNMTSEFIARKSLQYAKNPKVHIFGLGWYRRLAASHEVAIK